MKEEIVKINKTKTFEKINKIDNWGKKEQKNLKVSRRKEIMKIRAEINEKEMKEEKVKINKTKTFEKINKIDKPLVRLIMKKREENQINKLEMKKERLQQIMQKYKGL